MNSESIKYETFKWEKNANFLQQLIKLQINSVMKCYEDIFFGGEGGNKKRR